jgi:hypothetical protein
MSPSHDALVARCRIEILYRIVRHVGSAEEEIVDRWIAAEIISSEPCSWPLARLADGQLTEIRPFMTWRVIPGAEQNARALAA